ncbi:hypothetical protein [Roseibium algae]|uniref:Uncharacterized protein n=1 Tax=Roseibium algae TaxID=3123038 RepID=A0ABU8TQ08_9HYPH
MIHPDGSAEAIRPLALTMMSKAASPQGAENTATLPEDLGFKTVRAIKGQAVNKYTAQKFLDISEQLKALALNFQKPSCPNGADIRLTKYNLNGIFTVFFQLSSRFILQETRKIVNFSGYNFSAYPSLCQRNLIS